MIKTFKINLADFEEQTLSFLEKELEMRAKAVKKTLAIGFIGKQLWRNLSPKYLTEFQITSPELGLKGRIDRVKLESAILPYEIKTRDEVYENDKIQLAAYSLLLEDEFKKKINKGVIETKKRQEEILITQEMKSKVLEIADKIRAMETDGEAGFQNNFNKCKSCRLRKECFEL
jgi:CRISPR-associated protein Cas4